MRAGQGLILVTAALLSVGVVMVSSAGLEVGTGARHGTVEILAGRPALLAAAALLALWIGSLIPVRRIGSARVGGLPMPACAAVAIVVLLAAVHLPGLGREVNGARRWIDLGPIGFQPSEVAKWGVLVVLAWHATLAARAPGVFARGLLPALAFLGAVCGLVVTEDLGTAVLIGLAGAGVLVAAGARVWHLALLAPPGLAALGVAVASSPYRLERLRAFIDPYHDVQGSGYQLVQSLAAVHGGGLAGRGLGNGIQKLGYLPEDTSDFIFAVICEELGVMGAAAGISLFALLLLAGGSIVRRAGDPFSRVLGTGILLTLGLQVLVNIAVVTGMAPTKGIALPLVSAGGTGWVMTAFSVGLLVAMEREAAEPAAVSDAERRVAVRALGRLALFTKMRPRRAAGGAP